MLTVTLGTAKRIHFKQIISLTCPQDCLKIFSKCLSALQKLSTVLIYKQMLRIERCIFLPSLMFWVCVGVCVVSCSSIHNFPLICLLRPPFLFIFFFYAQDLCSLAEPVLQYWFRKRQLWQPSPRLKPALPGGCSVQRTSLTASTGLTFKKKEEKKKKAAFFCSALKGKRITKAK